MIRQCEGANLSKRSRRVICTTTALTFLCQNFAWAVCADGTTFPANGYVNGQPPAANWSPGVFTGTTGSIFVPDNSVFENNDPTQPLTGGGHNWVFDQGTTLCKETDVGPAGGTPTAWAIPSNNTADCLSLPIITTTTGNPPLPIITGFGDIPFQGQAITPTCDPTLLSQPGAPNPANTRFNQLGCAFSHGVATTPQTATTFLFVAGVKGGLFSIPLANAPNSAVGFAGKVISAVNFYSDIPVNQSLTNAAVSPDGMFAVVTSDKRQQFVYACLNPLGNPGDPSLPIDLNFSGPDTALVKCMQVGGNGLTVDLTTTFGPDSQPYFGGQQDVDTFNFIPGGSAAGAWPSCIIANSGFTTLQDAFNAHSANRCGNALPNLGFIAADITLPNAIISHGSYMYVPTTNALAQNGSPGGSGSGGSGSGGPGSGGSGSGGGSTVVQIKVTVDPVSGRSRYTFRTYLTGISAPVTGLGVADDLGSLMVFTAPSNGPRGEVITKLPLCEDLQ